MERFVIIVNGLKCSMLDVAAALDPPLVFFLWQIRFKKSKLFVEVELWNLDWFKYVEFDGDFNFIAFYIGNTLFGLIWTKKSKLSVHLIFGIWYLDCFENIKLDVMFFFSVLGLFLQVLFKKNNLEFWCYLINHPAVYSQTDLKSVAYV